MGAGLVPPARCGFVRDPGLQGCEAGRVERASGRVCPDGSPADPAGAGEIAEVAVLFGHRGSTDSSLPRRREGTKPRRKEKKMQEGPPDSSVFLRGFAPSRLRG